MLIVNVDLMFALDILNFHCCLIITMNVGNKILLQRNEINANYVRIRPWIAKRQKPVMCRAELTAWGKEIVLLIPCCGVEYCRVSVSAYLLIMCSGAAAGLLTQREDTGYCLVINWTHLAIIICSANLLTLHVLNGSVFTEFTLNKCSVTIYNNVFTDFISRASISNEKEWNKL